MDLELFGKSPAGRLVWVGQGEAAYWAFVPHPLPPALEPDKALWSALGEAMLSVGRLDGLARDLPDPHLLIAPFLRREAVVSSRIEGTRAELLDLYAYEAGQRLPRGSTVPEEDVREVYNYVRALEYGLQRRESLPLSLRFLRELHGLLLEGVRGEGYTAGEFRASQNWIGRPGSTLSTATYVPPPPAELRSALADFERYLYVKDEYPSLVRLAFLHYQFEAIHPFLDGNGRIGRLLLALLLVHWGLVSQPLLYLSEYFERNRRDYYDLLLAVSQHGAWREWVEFFVLGVAEQGERTVRKARALFALQEQWRQNLMSTRASTLTLRLADSLLADPRLTVRRAQEILGVGSHNTAKTHIRRLIAAGLLQESQSETGAQVYVAPAILEILQAAEKGE